MCVCFAGTSSRALIGFCLRLFMLCNLLQYQSLPKLETVKLRSIYARTNWSTLYSITKKLKLSYWFDRDVVQNPLKPKPWITIPSDDFYVHTFYQLKEVGRNWLNFDLRLFLLLKCIFWNWKIFHSPTIFTFDHLPFEIISLGHICLFVYCLSECDFLGLFGLF